MNNYVLVESILYADNNIVSAIVAPNQFCQGCGAMLENVKCAYCGRQYVPKCGRV